MPDPSIAINLGDHVLELSERSILIASHPGAPSDPITECVQLASDEAYRLYTALQAHFEHSERLTAARLAWSAYCTLDHPQHPWLDRIACTGCGAEHLVAHLTDNGHCATCFRQAACVK